MIFTIDDVLTLQACFKKNIKLSFNQDVHYKELIATDLYSEFSYTYYGTQATSAIGVLNYPYTLYTIGALEDFKLKRASYESYYLKLTALFTSVLLLQEFPEDLYSSLESIYSKEELEYIYTIPAYSIVRECLTEYPSDKFIFEFLNSCEFYREFLLDKQPLEWIVGLCFSETLKELECSVRDNCIFTTPKLGVANSNELVSVLAIDYDLTLLGPEVKPYVL